jgi:hypothetical protein
MTNAYRSLRGPPGSSPFPRLRKVSQGRLPKQEGGHPTAIPQKPWDLSSLSVQLMDQRRHGFPDLIAQRSQRWISKIADRPAPWTRTFFSARASVPLSSGSCLTDIQVRPSDKEQTRAGDLPESRSLTSSPQLSSTSTGNSLKDSEKAVEIADSGYTDSASPSSAAVSTAHHEGIKRPSHDQNKTTHV